VGRSNQQLFDITVPRLGQPVSELLPARAETAGGHRWVTRRLLVSRVAYRVADCSSIFVSHRGASALDMSKRACPLRLCYVTTTEEALPMTGRATDSHRWFALFIVCLGYLMIVLDVTIVGVALPSIRADLGFSENSLAWVANAYLLTFGGFLLLAGRLGDLFGHRHLFLIGIVLFTLASLGCGLATSQATLVGSRALQGLAAAVVSAVALSLIVTLFTEPTERAKAMGVFGFVAAGGGTIGVLLGGILTDALSWHWIFLVNVPVGITVVALARLVLPRARIAPASRRLDGAGAIAVTASLMFAVYAIVNGNQVGWTTARTLGLLTVAGLLFASFVVIEARTPAPLVPLGLFRRRNLSTANVVGILWAAAMFAWFFLSALYLQLVLGYSPLQVGLCFLPANVIMAVLSLGLSAKLVLRFGIRVPLASGLLLAAAGLALLARAPVDGAFVADVLPSMLLLGLGAGMAFNPLLLAAMSDVEPNDAGLASGLVNTSFMMGGALGLAILASVAASRSEALLASGDSHLTALTGGYQAAFLIGAVFAVAAAVLAAVVLRRGTGSATAEPGQTAAEAPEPFADAV
jgi:EmrB/QacA subfamily drug resistance transporter